MVLNQFNTAGSLASFANKMKNKIATSVGSAVSNLNKPMNVPGTAQNSSANQAVKNALPAIQSAAQKGLAVANPTTALINASASKVGTAVGNAAAKKVSQTMQQPIVGVPGTAQRAPVTTQPVSSAPINAQLSAVQTVKNPVQASISPTIASKAPVSPAIQQTPYQTNPGQSNGSTNNVTTGAVPQMDTFSTMLSMPPEGANQPAGPSDLEQQRDAIRKSLLGATTLSPQEQAAQAELARLNEEANAAITGVDTEGSSRGFTTGYATGLKGAYAKAADSAKLPLEARIANLQAARNAQQQADTTKLGFIQSDIDAERATQKEAGALSREDAATKRTILLQALQGGATQQQMAQILAAKTPEEAIQIAGALLNPKQKSDFVTVGENQSVIDPITGQVIYQGSGAGAGENDKLLTPTEAKELGVPYGTTRGQAFGQTPGAGQQSLTAEQSKARQFAVDAENANNVLGTLGYDPGIIEPPLPNQLKSNERQQFEQAARAFVNATLRRESGATITDAEYSNKYKQLIPQAGDGDAVKQQKAAARQAAVQSIQQAGMVDQGQSDPLGLFSNASTTALNGSIQIGSRLGKVNNNPGNLRFAGQVGATQGEGGFARFSSPQAGYDALKSQIALDASRGLTLGQFINKYAPPTENDTGLYVQQMAQATGANANTPVRNINLDALARAMAQKESLTRIA